MCCVLLCKDILRNKNCWRDIKTLSIIESDSIQLESRGIKINVEDMKPWRDRLTVTHLRVFSTDIVETVANFLCNSKIQVLFPMESIARQLVG